MSIKRRVHASPASIDEMLDDARTGPVRSPVVDERVSWFKGQLEYGFEKQLGLSFNRALTQSDAIVYKRENSSEEHAERCVGWLSHLHVNFAPGNESKSTPYVRVSHRSSVGGMSVYFVVMFNTLRNTVSVRVNF